MDGQLSIFPLKSRIFWAGTDKLIGKKFLGHLVYFNPILVQRVPCPCFPIFNHYFYKKTKPIHIQKYLFGIGIWVWAAKNELFSLSVSVIRYDVDCFAFYTGLSTFLLREPRLKNDRKDHYFWSHIGVNSVSLAICYPK